MIIRPANTDDTPAILAMAERFYATTSYAEWAEFCPESTQGRIALLMGYGVLLVAESDGAVVGMVGLILGPSLCNDAVICANEVMWWVNPEARDTGAGMALLQAVAPACAEKGAKAIQMVHLRNSPPQVSTLYERLGYRNTESSYTMVVN